jgi:outer membrane protein insertion porin family
MRKSDSSLNCLNSTTQPVRTRSSRFGIFSAAVVAVLATTAIPSLHAQVQARPAFSAPATPQVLCQPVVIGNRRIPKDTIIARLYSHPGDAYDPAVVERDFNSVWNTGYFDDVRIEKIDTPACVQLNVYVRERPTIREILYKGLNAVSESDVLERFKKAKVALSVESQFDETKVKRAEVVLQELLSEHGHQFATIKTEVKTLPPAAVSLTFIIKEGPTVKVGKI